MNTERSSPDSHLVHDADGTFRAAIGPDATNLMRAVYCKQALKMHVGTGGKMRLTRNANPQNLLAIAAEYTGKKYGRRDYQLAMDDLDKWIQTMKAALPSVQTADVLLPNAGDVGGSA